MIRAFQNLIAVDVQIESAIGDNGNIFQKFLRAMLKKLNLLARLLPASYVYSLLLNLIKDTAEQKNDDEALRFLLRLDNRIYEMQTSAAVRYEKGKHPKHRHMDYHRFFIERIVEGERVLDIGCRYGEAAYSIVTQTGAKVVGIEIGPENIKIAKEWHQHPDLEFRVGDALELKDEAFDVIVLSNVLEHIAERDRFLKNVQRVTGAKRFLIRVPLFERDWRVPLKFELGVEWRLDPTHETEYTLEVFAEETRAGGLKITHLESRWGEIWAELEPAL